MKMRRCLFGFVAVVAIWATGCGDSGDSDEEGGSDTGVCERCGEQDTNAKTDSGGGGGPKADRELMGTCLDRPAEGSDENLRCRVLWAQYGAPADYADDCTREEPENEWRASKESCPTDSKHIGTCSRVLGHVYQEQYYYKPADPKSQKDGCEFMGQGTWEPAK